MVQVTVVGSDTPRHRIRSSCKKRAQGDLLMSFCRGRESVDWLVGRVGRVGRSASKIDSWFVGLFVC